MVSFTFKDGYGGTLPGNWTGTDYTVNPPTIVTTPTHIGKYALSTTSLGYSYKTFTATPTAYARGYFYISTIGAAGNSVRVLGLYDSGWLNETQAFFYNNTGPATDMYWGIFTGGAAHYYGPYTISALTWYCLELRRTVGAGAGIVTLWVNDIQVGNLTAETVTNNADRFACGAQGSNTMSATVYADDGAISTSRIGSIKMNLPKPEIGLKFSRNLQNLMEL